MAVDWLKRFEPYLTGEANDGEHRLYCPIHENPETSKTPSASINPAKGAFNCFSKCGGYRVGQLWELVGEDIAQKPATATKPTVRRRGNVRSINSARSRRGTPTTELPTDIEIREWTERLVNTKTALAPLRAKRGLRRDILEKYEIGFNGDRYTIPVRDVNGKLVNVRRYKLGATHDKMLNWPGFGQAELYGIDALGGEWVVLCEGEMDKLIGRQYGFPTLSTTAGAGTWSDRWTPLFRGKRVFIVYDVDDQGTQGAKKVAMRLSKVNAEVHIVRLPLTMRGGDLTNYFVDQGFGKKDFRELLDGTPTFESKALGRLASREAPKRVSLIDTMDSDLANKPLEFVSTITGKVQPPYMMPRRLAVTCSMDWGPKCKKCPMEAYHGGQHLLDIPADDKLLLRLVDKTEEGSRAVILKELDVPTTCPIVQLASEQEWAVEQLIVMPSVDDQDADATVTRQVYNVGPHRTPVNTTAKLVGVNTSDPRSGRMVMQTWECAETKTSLDSFQLTPELLEELAVFQPREDQRVSDKLWEIADDLSSNVTRIYGRHELHIAYDLVWHSVLDFYFRKTRLGKGWLEMLVMGDTRTGKSEAAMRLAKHYQNGVLTSCEGATLAGLIGGAQQVGNSWVITWGTIPLQDRRLVVLDEVSGLKDKNVLEQMSSVRSSGRAEVTKIVSQSTNARTRLVWISNPVDGRRINEMNRGAIEAIEKLVPNPEDIARFDFAMVAASADVDSHVINAARQPKVDHVYTSELCAKLVLWAWSRGPTDVRWEYGAQRLILRVAEAMGKTYVSDPPLIQSENARVKLARIAVAIAARLFSHDGAGQRVYVTKAHVYAARRFLDRLYAMQSFGYAAYSAKEIRNREVAEASRRDCYAWLRQAQHVAQALATVVNDKEFRVRDLEEFGGLMREEAQQAVVRLVQLRMVTRHNKGYIRMGPELIDVVRRLERREMKGE